MGGVREGEKTSHHALQDRPNRFPCGELGIRTRRWLAVLACGSKRHPSLPPNPGGSWDEDLGSAPSQLRSGGPAQGCKQGVWRSERPRSRPFVRQGAGDQSLPTQSTSYTGAALLQRALPVPTALKYRRLLGFGKRCVQGFTQKMFSWSDSITNRKMAKPEVARTQLPGFQHGWEKRGEIGNKWTKTGISVMISNALFTKPPWMYLLDMLYKPQVNRGWICGTTWESSKFRP